MNDELFLETQRLLKVKEKFSKSTQTTSLFSGIVHCNVCGNRMSKKQDNRVKTKLMRYCCDNACRRKPGTFEYKCTNHKLIREETIEKYLLDNIIELAKKYYNENYIISYDTSKQDNSQKINSLNKKIDKLKDLYLDDLIDKDTYKKDYEKLTKELNQLKEDNNSKPKKDISKLNKLINLDIATIYNSFTLEEKRTFWINLIEEIKIENGEIKEVIFL